MDSLVIFGTILTSIATDHGRCQGLFRLESFLQMVSVWHACAKQDRRILLSAALPAGPPICLLFLQAMRLPAVAMDSGQARTLHQMLSHVCCSAIHASLPWTLTAYLGGSTTSRSSTKKFSIQVSRQLGHRPSLTSVLLCSGLMRNYSHGGENPGRTKGRARQASSNH